MNSASWSFRLARLAYNLLIHALIPVALLHFLWRSRRESGYRRHLGERLGAGPDPEPGPDLWVHAASLGEMRVAGILVNALCREHPKLRIQLTTLTPAGRAEGERMQASGLPVTVRYLPLDSPPLLRRVIRHQQPGLLILIETELWPNLLWHTHRAGVPTVLVNARLSPSRRGTYRRLRALYGPLLAGLEWVAAQGPEDAGLFRSLGARRVEVAGNLKFDLPSVHKQTDLARTHFAAEWLWVAGSTHPGEERQLLDVHRRLRDAHPETRIQLLLAPRHPSRAQEIRGQAEDAGFSALLRSRLPAAGSDDDVIVLDTLGELAALYALADAAFVGGSLVNHGGQNPLEPIAAGCPVIVGPDTRNFADMVRQLVADRAIVQVADAEGLRDALEGLLRIPEHGAAMIQQAQRTLSANRGATARTLDLLRPLLPPPGPSGR
ncbi:3-deoxy-D-manno-octulosonic acid transferase [Thioalkalivibrio sp.]|uniref:3-deoxy-D-manno-octulosonic acid transferase n=1 Tax=Thioalkalivibrio sp. TaxID=2093813 RepID=UPI0012D5128A|nr:3-deoxy-D-manno-octulosonic acid transferase [Thioalkalivibrio sp.]TVP76563.1 MAG: 3-deoxy-D-manno-octulosonic acid transferase [Thioalkalivibrio sp.]